MNQPQPQPHLGSVRTGFVLGALALFLFTVIVLRAFGVEGWGVPVAGLFVGLFAGGALGAMVAMRIDQARGT